MIRALGLALLWVMACPGPLVLSQELSGSRQSGAGTRTISGSVVLRGTMVSPVRVTISSATRTFQRTVYADGSGSFGVGGVPAGQYTIELEAEGYLTQREIVEVPPGSGVFVVQFMMRLAPAASKTSSKEPAVSVATLHVPSDARNEFIAGQREAGHKNWKQARKHFERALQKYADFPQALWALSLLDLGEQQPERALERLRRAVAIDPSFAEGQVTLSHVFNLLGRHAEAMDAARKATALRPDIWEAEYELGVAALSLGRDSEALQVCDQMESRAGHPVAEAKLLRAGVWLRRSRYAEAKEELVAFLHLAPDHRFVPLAKKALEEAEAKLKPMAPQ